jgi:hypothetical protein
MSFASAHRNAEIFEQQVKEAIIKYQRISQDYLPVIKDALNNRLNYSRTIRQEWKPRMWEDDEGEVHDNSLELDEELKALTDKFENIERLLYVQVTKAQNALVSARQLIHSVESEFGLESLRTKSDTYSSLESVIMALEEEMESFWYQFLLQKKILQEISSINNNVLGHQKALVLSSMWTYLPYL